MCTDVDECAIDNGGCHAQAICTDTVGSRTCTCRPGYTGDGFSCTGMDITFTRVVGIAIADAESAWMENAARQKTGRKNITSVEALKEQNRKDNQKLEKQPPSLLCCTFRDTRSWITTIKAIMIEGDHRRILILSTSNYRRREQRGGSRCHEFQQKIDCDSVVGFGCIYVDDNNIALFLLLFRLTTEDLSNMKQD